MWLQVLATILALHLAMLKWLGEQSLTGPWWAALYLAVVISIWVGPPLKRWTEKQD